MAERPSVALILGGAKCVFEDIDAALDLGEYDYTIAINDIGARWLGHVDVWATLHFEKLPQWISDRQARGGKPVKQYFTHNEKSSPANFKGIQTQYRFDGQTKSGSSGLFAVKVALVDLNIDKAVLCGIPMLEKEAHFFRPEADWKGAASHRRGWEQTKNIIEHRVRSMSGWTRELLGAPTDEWLREPCP